MIYNRKGRGVRKDSWNAKAGRNLGGIHLSEKRFRGEPQRPFSGGVGMEKLKLGTLRHKDQSYDCREF